MSYTIRGETAQIKWHYHCAATLGSWTLTDKVLEAQIVSVDTFRVSQSPLTWVVGSVVRPLEGLQITGGTLTARLGPMESSHELVTELPDRHA